MKDLFTYAEVGSAEAKDYTTDVGHPGIWELEVCICLELLQKRMLCR